MHCAAADVLNAHPRTAVPLQRVTVLVVADDERAARATRRVLEAAGHSVVTAFDVPQAAEVLVERAVDVVVSNLHPDATSDLDLLVVVRACDPDAPVVSMAAPAACDPCDAAGSFGPVQYLSQRGRWDDLLHAVERAPHVRRIAQKEREARTVSRSGR